MLYLDLFLHNLNNFRPILVSHHIPDYYTDRSSGDFTEVFPAQELLITSSSTQISIPITNDDICESTEEFNVYLSDIDGGLLGFKDNTLDSACTSKVKITDDDGQHLFIYLFIHYLSIYLFVYLFLYTELKRIVATSSSAGVL